MSGQRIKLWATVEGPGGAAPVLAGSIVYTVRIDETGQVVQREAARNLADGQTFILPAKVGAPAVVVCDAAAQVCELYVMGETIVFNECPENP